jgi:hypothetical protein
MHNNVLKAEQNAEAEVQVNHHLGSLQGQVVHLRAHDSERVRDVATNYPIKIF